MWKFLLTQLMVMRSTSNSLENSVAKNFTFLKFGNELINVNHIVTVDISKIENLEICVVLNNGKTAAAFGHEAIEAALVLKPQAIEGVKLKFPKNAWIIHNLLAHPAMQILSLFGKHRAAFALHDATIPHPVKNGDDDLEDDLDNEAKTKKVQQSSELKEKKINPSKKTKSGTKAKAAAFKKNDSLDDIKGQ